MKAAFFFIAAVSLAPYVDRALRETNSHAATVRGAKQYQQKQYAAASKSFGAARAAAPSPTRAFNLGTAQIAAGDRENGAATLSSAMADRSVRPLALFNRGNGALASNAYDSAIRDYTESLRLQPNYAPAKRNLEIALQQKAQEDKQKQSGGQGQQPKPQPQPNPSQQNPQAQPKGNADLEALLRSVQQQEQEELARMRAQRNIQGHVGW